MVGMMALGARNLKSSRNKVISKVPKGTSEPSISVMMVAMRWAKCAPRVGIPNKTIEEAP